MRAIVGSKIKIENYTPEILQWCQDNLILTNPEYYKRERMGKWCGNIPQEIFLYERVGKDLILPFGCVASIKRLGYALKSSILPIKAFSYDSRIKPYTYQEKAIKAALNAKNGVIVMPCGSGKTQTGLEIAARIGGRTLWLTHTQDLLNQSMNRAKAVFGCDNGSYGLITGGKVNIGSGITFATVQTMSKLDLQSYRDIWDCVIVDECHKAIGSPTKVMQFYKVVSALACRYKFGLTATPRRADGLEKSMFALLGEIIAEIKKSDVAETTCPVSVITADTEYAPNYDMVLSGDGTINYASLVDDLISNKERFDFVLRWLQDLSGATLVLGNRVDYLRRLNKAYSGRSLCLSALGQSKTAREVRKDALKKLNDGEIDVLFATYALAKEGLDIPALRYVVFATPEKDETTVMQAAGRVGRTAIGKDRGIVIDFIDDFGMYKGWAKKRQRYYKKLGYDVLT